MMAKLLKEVAQKVEPFDLNHVKDTDDNKARW